MKKLFLALAFALASATAAHAQAEPTPEHVAVAMDALAAMDIETQLSASIEMALQLQMQQQPMLAQVEEPMRAFFRKHMSWDALKDEYSTIYARQFTIDELRQLAAFYRSPVGRKLSSASPVLMQQGAELGQRRVQENMPELMEVVMATLQGGGSTGKP
jgi:hypothetical protein